MARDSWSSRNGHREECAGDDLEVVAALVAAAAIVIALAREAAAGLSFSANR
jgi:hypothetical protein